MKNKTPPTGTTDVSVADLVWQQIDKYALDEECRKVPALLAKYAKEAADLRMEIAVHKQEVKVREATVASAVRAHPERYGVTKITEATIAETVERDQERQDLNELMLGKQGQLWLVEGLLTAVDGRRRMLESLVYLHGAGYFGTSRTVNGGDEVEREAPIMDTRRPTNVRTRK
jgi:hypothetical protein